jgi:predicted RNA binding protein YcfA (HicA-like mRNA interferase family)
VYSAAIGKYPGHVAKEGVMTQARKLLGKLLSGSPNLRFSEAMQCLKAWGFYLARVRGSHHIFAHPGIPELVNLQDVDGFVKPYQIRQVLRLVERYNLIMEDKS